MNRNQRRVLMAVAAVVLAMLLYPPFTRGTRNYVTMSYDWLFGFHNGSVIVELLLVQWLGVGIVGAIAYFLLADRKQ